MTIDPTPPDDSPAAARLAVLAAASGGDAGAVYQVVSGLMTEGTPFHTVLFEVLAPLEAEVGRRWEQGDFGISEEHVITATLETVVALLAGSFDIEPGARRLVVACAEGDAHSLPARMVAAYLVFLGWRAVFLGPGHPAAELEAFLQEQPPEALVLSCTITTALPGARKCIRAAHRTGVPVLAGGPGYGPAGRWASALGADAWANDPDDVDAILNSWEPDPAASEAAAVDGGDALRRMGARRADLVAAVLGALEEAEAAALVDPAQLRSDLDL
ncbi:MAG: cobalamin-dependent protein, partial [Acidimicrobiia bacterium]|nr:cobalamin-dependent protein [Acidimicrobiia bacterium]